MFRGVLTCALALGLMASACSDPVTSTTGSAPDALSPDEAAAAFIKAVANGDVGALATVTDSSQVAVLLGLEGASSSEIATMLVAGVPVESLELFWSAFAASLPAFADLAASDLTPEPSSPIAAHPDFRSVAVASTGTNTAVLVLRDGDGWVIDLFATAGPELAAPMRSWLTALGNDAAATQVRDAVAAFAPSFEAAVAARGELPPGAALEIQALLLEASR